MAPSEMLDVVWSPSALRDVQEILRVFKERDAASAAAFVTAIRRPSTS
jgi:plasmid stabilization system protein ParE